MGGFLHFLFLYIQYIISVYAYCTRMNILPTVRPPMEVDLFPQYRSHRNFRC